MGLLDGPPAEPAEDGPPAEPAGSPSLDGPSAEPALVVPGVTCSWSFLVPYIPCHSPRHTFLFPACPWHSWCQKLNRNHQPGLLSKRGSRAALLTRSGTALLTQRPQTAAPGQGFLARGAVRVHLHPRSLLGCGSRSGSLSSAPSVPPLPRPRPFRPAALRGADPGPFRQVANVVFAKYNCTLFAVEIVDRRVGAARPYLYIYIYIYIYMHNMGIFSKE